MIDYMDKKKIIEMKVEGLSNREVARRTTPFMANSGYSVMVSVGAASFL